MTNGRNRLIIRSLIFGLVAKVGGSLIVFAGLPFIAYSLEVASYATFLKSMSAAAIVTMCFGAIGTLSIRDIASSVNSDSESLNEAKRQALGLFISAFMFGTVVLGLIYFVTQGQIGTIVSFAAALALFQCMFQWGDVCRVALRSDYVSSLAQFAASISVIALLFIYRGSDLFIIVLIYFGVPVLSNLFLSLQLMLKDPSLRIPIVTMSVIRRHIGGVIPIVFNSLAEYAKIFGAGYIVLAISDNSNYAKYTTIFLFAARIVNPLSLITRPLVPAYIDAVSKEDNLWLKNARKVFFFGLAGSWILAITTSLIAPVSVISWLVPMKSVEIGRLDIIAVVAFLCGQCLITLMTPFFYAARKEVLFASVNFASVTIALAGGSLLVSWGGATIMMVLMAVCVGISSSILMSGLLGEILAARRTVVQGLE